MRYGPPIMGDNLRAEIRSYLGRAGATPASVNEAAKLDPSAYGNRVLAAYTELENSGTDGEAQFRQAMVGLLGI